MTTRVKNDTHAKGVDTTGVRVRISRGPASGAKRYRFAVFMLLVNLCTVIAIPDKAGLITSNLMNNITGTLSILPPIFVLLLTVEYSAPRCPARCCGFIFGGA